ncbi:MAG: hypothetical protein WED33_01340 [Bacteroidia bacterium]
MCFSCFNKIEAQERVITVGVQIKPLFSSKFFGTGPQSLIDSGFTYTIRPASGYAFGMVVRRGFTPTLSLEFGLNYIVRNYEVGASDGVVSNSERMRIVGYEIPFSQLIFIRLSEKIYMNASAGLCLNMFPSDVYEESDNFLAFAGRNNIFLPSLLANLGFEYRTKDKGYFYLGASLNRPFQPFYGYSIDYIRNNVILNSALTQLNGTYLSVDLKYFFHEDPEKRKKGKK